MDTIKQSSSDTSVELFFTLENKAKNAGGDKYVCTTNPTFNIYFPQTISRVGGKSIDRLKVNISSASS